MACVETYWWLVSWPSCNQSYGLFQARFRDYLGTDYGIVLQPLYGRVCSLCMADFVA